MAALRSPLPGRYNSIEINHGFRKPPLFGAARSPVATTVDPFGVKRTALFNTLAPLGTSEGPTDSAQARATSTLALRILATPGILRKRRLKIPRRFAAVRSEDSKESFGIDVFADASD